MALAGSRLITGGRPGPERHLAIGKPLARASGGARLSAGLKMLRAHRLGNGRWRRFPYWYTVLALSEIDLPIALAEKRYAASICESLLKQKPRQKRLTLRRHAVARRILEQA